MGFTDPDASKAGYKELDSPAASPRLPLQLETSPRGRISALHAPVRLSQLSVQLDEDGSPGTHLSICCRVTWK